MARHGTLYNRWIQSKAWGELRVQVIREQQGWCAWCRAKHDWLVPVEVVHHQVEVESGKTIEEQRRLMFSRSNCVGLCKKCHSDYHNDKGYHKSDVVTERQQARHEAWQDAMEKRFKGPSNEGDTSTS